VAGGVRTVSQGTLVRFDGLANVRRINSRTTCFPCARWPMRSAILVRACDESDWPSLASPDDTEQRWPAPIVWSWVGKDAQKTRQDRVPPSSSALNVRRINPSLIGPTPAPVRMVRARGPTGLARYARALSRERPRALGVASSWLALQASPSALAARAPEPQPCERGTRERQQRSAPERGQPHSRQPEELHHRMVAACWLLRFDEGDQGDPSHTASARPTTTSSTPIHSQQRGGDRGPATSGRVRADCTAAVPQRLKRTRSLSRRGAAPPGSERPYDRFFRRFGNPCG